MARRPRAPGATQEGLFSHRCQGVVGEDQLHAVQLEDPSVLLDEGVLRFDQDPDQGGKVDMGVEPPHTMFALAFDERRPALMSCATNGGEVYSSRDGGESWAALRPPPAGTQIYALARG